MISYGVPEDWELLLVLLGFLVILEAGYLYVFRKGVLDWATLKD